MSKVLFSLVGGLSLVVLIAENFVFLGVPVRISAWFLLGAALLQVWLCGHKLLASISVFYSNADLRTLAVVALVTIAFHGIVPCQQGLQWYAGKGYPDYYNYVTLAEFLKEEPYGTGQQEVGLRPWLVNPATWLKKGRIGQSIVTAEISVWSDTDAKTGYAATVIFFLSVLSISVYGFLRETRVDGIMAGSGALLAALLPAVTRLSLDGFLSHLSILFVFPFFTSLLRHGNLRARSFTLFFSLTLAYVVAAYSEMAPIGFCTLLLGVMFVRGDKLPTKRLVLMSCLLLTALMNVCYLRNMIEFLAQQYGVAANATYLNLMAPDVLTLRGWSELIFGSVTNSLLASIFHFSTLLLALLIVWAFFLLSRKDKVIIGAILLPVLMLISYLATRTPPPSYPIAKLTLSMLPFAIGLTFVALSRITDNIRTCSTRILNQLLSASIVAAAAAGSARYYSEVLNNEGLLRVFREPRFLSVCRQLEQIRDKRVFLFEDDHFLTPWLCYHARHNDVYVDRRSIGNTDFSQFALFSRTPDLENIDFAVTGNRIVDLRKPDSSSGQ